MQEEKPLDLLIIDKNTELLNNYSLYFSTKGFSVVTVSTLKESSEVIIMNHPYVILVDIDVVNAGNELFQSLRKIGVESQIIIHSEKITDDIQYKKQTGLCYEFIKKGNIVFEYLYEQIVNAKNASIKIREINEKVRDEDASYKKELEWLLWQQRKNQNSKYSLGGTILETLTHSIFQGMGMGSAISILELIEMSMIEEGNFTKVKTNLIHSLLKNAEPMRLIKEKLDGLIKHLNKEYDKELLTSNNIQDILSKAIEDTEEHRNIKKQKIIRSTITHLSPVIANKNFLGLCFRELLINAYKYSPDNSRIMILKGYSENGLSILIINSVLNVAKGIKGIPREYENQVFEPFFRINKIYDERFYLEELGFGVGLSILQKGIHSLGGKVFLYEALDHASSIEPEKKVIAEMVLLDDPNNSL